MAKIAGTQLSLITQCVADEPLRSEIDDRIVGDWGWEKLGTEQFLVPNSSPPELGTEQFLVPNSPLPELGTEIWLVPNYDDWKPPIGCFQQKWIKDHQYWYWRYYNVKGKKASLYLHKDYNKAVRKAIKIGVPSDAKLPNLPTSDPQAQTGTDRTDNLIDIASTPHTASRSGIAA